MKQLVIIALLALTSVGAQAQTSETRKSADFTSLEVKNGIEVFYTQSNQPSLKVEADSKTNLDRIATEFGNGTLRIYFKEDENQKAVQGTARVYVSAPGTANFKVLMGASVKVNGKLNITELNVKLKNGASFTAEAICNTACNIKAESGSMFRGLVTAPTLTAKADKGSTIKLSGTADASTIASNGGTILAGKFLTKTAEVRAVHGATAYVNAQEAIDADADSSSSVIYYGDPATVNLGTNSYAIKRDNLKLALNN